ncbi:GNAT family N-acetyltransferase [Aestuariibacter sp. A3R04]|uniref:GNAT family N-acetyltransferase n=1 Tax=Aestuariibacter sp. A3R04 TaxID=2841571 RepID=UPI001C09F917|nr:GNAT family N-acetyltransferase [Aestuariibacter sp. A3R04]MBU3021745.1 GNAT family N-acetyltransferase [Aestuariibacter sp. A3R04]
MSVTCVTSSEGLARLESDWEALYQQADNAHVFLSFDWIQIWLEVFGGLVKTLLVYCCWEDDKLVAVLPLYQSRLNGMCFFIGTGEPEQSEVCSEYQDILVHPNCINGATALLQAALSAHFRTLVFKNVRHDAYLRRMINSVLPQTLIREYSQERRYFVPLAADDISRTKLYKKANRYLNAFFRQPEAAVRYPENESDVEEQFSRLITLHRQRWSSRQQQVIFDDAHFLKFHTKTITRLWRKNRLVLTEIAVGDEVIASFYGFKNPKSIFFYQSGINDKFKPNVSPGTIMHLIEARAALTHQLNEYDFLGSKPENTYKGRLTDHSEPLYRIVAHASRAAKWVHRITVFRARITNRMNRVLNG